MTPEARARRRVRTPVLVVTAGAWVALVAAGGHGLGAAAHLPGVALREGGADALHAHHASELVGAAEQGASAAALLPFVGGWLLMLAAMMAPLLVPALHHVRARSLARRRRRAVVLLVAAYAAAWTAGGLVLLAVATSLAALEGPTGIAAAAGLVLVVLWQASPLKQRCLNRHHAHPPLAAFGRAADRSVLRFGAVHAAWCFGSCWALMLLPLLLGTAHLPVMALVTLWMWAERLERPRGPSWRLRLPVRAVRALTAQARVSRRPASARLVAQPSFR